MGLFGRRSRFPRDMLDGLALMGRYEMDPQGSGIDGGEVAQRWVVPFLADAQRDPEGFTADLRALVASDTGGFATYGASRLVWDLLSGFHTPDAVALLDDAIAFKRAFGLAGFHLTGYEWKRWTDEHGPGSW